MHFFTVKQDKMAKIGNTNGESQAGNYCNAVREGWPQLFS